MVLENVNVFVLPVENTSLSDSAATVIFPLPNA
jgi:hypothetical protein